MKIRPSTKTNGAVSSGGPPAPTPLDLPTIYRHHAQFVWLSLQRLGVRPADLDDVAHDVFVIVHTRLGSYDNTSRITTWLFGICMRVAANYRLAPRYRWPTQIVDVKRAIAWVRENIAEYGGDPDYLILTGGSAGGHLSALATVTPSDPVWQPGFEDADTSVSGCVPFYGVYDFDSDDAYAKSMRRFLSRVVFPRGATTDDFRNASALHRLTDDVPEFLVVHGANDSLANIEQARSFVARLREINPGKVTYLELPGTQHAFEVFGSVRARHVIRGVGRWLDWHRAQWLAEHARVEQSEVAL